MTTDRERRQLEEDLSYYRVRYHEAQEQARRDAWQAWEERERQRKARLALAREQMHTADTWTEALHKRESLLRTEAGQCHEEYDRDLLASIRQWIAATERARKRYTELLEAAETAIRQQVAELVEADDPSLAQYLRDNDINGCLEI